jgi:hypothetical protein
MLSFILQYFKENPDHGNPAYNTKYGIYSEGCGLDNVMISWGHDDYMYLVYIFRTPFPITQYNLTPLPVRLSFHLNISLTCFQTVGG